MLADVRPATHTIRFLNAVAASEHLIDLCIIVTPAHCRAALCQEIASICTVKAWILEKVLAQSSHQLDAIEEAIGLDTPTFVNTSRRLMPWHQAIGRALVSDILEPIKVVVDGGGWGLACNAIHFIDLVAWWTGSRLLSVDTDQLQEWRPSKRAGFQEVDGVLRLYYENQSELTLNCRKEIAPIKITIHTASGDWLIEEEMGMALGPRDLQISGELVFQSVLTAPLVTQILTTHTCGLPSLQESAALHRPFLDALLRYWNKTQARSDLIVPIT
jgi:predicted dehydrogenase